MKRLTGLEAETIRKALANPQAERVRSGLRSLPTMLGMTDPFGLRGVPPMFPEPKQGEIVQRMSERATNAHPAMVPIPVSLAKMQAAIAEMQAAIAEMQAHMTPAMRRDRMLREAMGPLKVLRDR